MIAPASGCPGRSLRVLILTPHGRDEAIDVSLLADGGMKSCVCPTIAALIEALHAGAGAALISDEAVRRADLRELAAWIGEQPAWSDFPFVLLTRRGLGTEQNPDALRWMQVFRNISMVERPCHAVTLVSVVRTALGSRRRQYEARAMIEAQRATADALRENEEHLRFTLTAGQLGAWSLDTRHWVLEATDQYRANFGRPPGEPFSYEEMRASIPREEWRLICAAFDRARLSGEPYEIEYTVIWPDGSEHCLASRGRMMRNGDRPPFRLVGVSSDITARRRKDDELRRYRERLEELVAERTRELEEANRQLRAQAAERERAEARLRQAQKMEAVGQLTGGIAHDFNNLLSAIMGSLELISSRSEDPRILRLTGNALTAVTRGARLTRQLLAFSRTQRLDLVPVVLNRLVEGMHALLMSSLGPGIAVRYQLDLAAGTCLADANQLELAILNLAINARDAMPDGGTLTIATGEPKGPAAGLGRMVAVSVCDSGEGMQPEVLERAFEPFFTTKPVGRGSGLGLSQVYGIARQSGGTATIESTLGVGTTVAILLPRVHAAAGAADTAEGSARSPPADAPAPRSTVLVVDDDDDVRRFLVESLETLGYGVAEAAHGQAGLERLGARPAPDLMIVDFAMPGMNGAEVATEALRRWPDLPIVLATGYAETASLAGGLSGLPVLRKPFHMAELATAVHAALKARGSAPGPRKGQRALDPKAPMAPLK